MSKLSRQLKTWSANGLLTSEQAQNILEYETKQLEQGRPWVIYALMILGAVVVGIGMISLIAANWAQIPPMVKLTTNFVLLGLVAFGVWQAREKNHLLAFELFLVLFAGLCLSSIGLISQVFHTGGKWYHALLFWSLITALLPLVSRRSFLAYLWVATFLMSLGVSLYYSLTLLPYVGHHPISVYWALSLFSLMKGLSSNKFMGAHPISEAFLFWGLIGGAIALMGMELWFPFFWREEQFFPGASLLLTGLLALAVAIGIYLRKDWRKSQKTSLWLGLVFFMLPYFFYVSGIKLDFTLALLTLLILGCMAAFWASLEKKKTFQLVLGLIGLRFFFLYLEAFKGLAMTGMGMILSGGLIIGLALLWNKMKGPLEAWAKGFLK